MTKTFCDICGVEFSFDYDACYGNRLERNYDCTGTDIKPGEICRTCGPAELRKIADRMEKDNVKARNRLLRRLEQDAALGVATK